MRRSLAMKFSAFAFALFAVLAASLARAGETALPETSLYNLDQTWTRQDGGPVKLAQLGGKLVVAAMGYTTCKDLCPAIVADMAWIERRLPDSAKPRVEFVFFSFDSEADSPERLRLYADGHGLDLDHWMLLGSNPDNVRELAAALSVGYRRDDAGGFNHQSVITLLDERGEIVMQQRGVQADSRELLEKLTALAAR
jgi:protein SCO1